MPTYQVDVICQITYRIAVEANDMEQAWEQAMNMSVEDVTEGDFQAMRSTIRDVEVNRQQMPDTR